MKAVAPVVLGVLLVAGCSGGAAAPPAPSPAPVSAPAPAPVSAPPVAPAAPAAAAVAAPPPAQPAAPTPRGAPAPAPPAGQAPARCTSGRLTGSLGPAEGTAGSAFRTLVLTNNGPGGCELHGFPGVSYVAGDDGHQVGPAAAFDGPRGGTVVLAAGRAATARLRLVDVGVFDAAACRPTDVRGLRVYPPGSTTSLFVPVSGRGCAGNPGRAQLTVTTLGRS